MDKKDGIKITVRLSEEENNQLAQVMAENRLNKSEVIRMMMSEEFHRYASIKRITLDEDERKLLMTEVTTLVEEVNYLRGDMNRIGNNVNQIARKMTVGDEVIYKGSDIERGFATIDYYLDELESGVSKIWQLLV